ncbi:hypothetical protein N0V90_011119 [Kalmusia sp. IMI 367209]|nr:hypothetical protein N0V90_011119 [Kalmusia sp. IMI 367209]
MKFSALLATALCAFSATASPVSAPAAVEIEKRAELAITVWELYPVGAGYVDLPNIGANDKINSIRCQ